MWQTNVYIVIELQHFSQIQSLDLEFEPHRLLKKCIVFWALLVISLELRSLCAGWCSRQGVCGSLVWNQAQWSQSSTSCSMLPKHIREAKYANTSLACMQNKGWFKFFTLVWRTLGTYLKTCLSFSSSLCKHPANISSRICFPCRRRLTKPFYFLDTIHSWQFSPICVTHWPICHM